MTHFRTTPLSTFPASNKRPTQCTKFKELLHSAIGSVEGVSLVTVTDRQEQTHGVVACFDADDRLAAAWVQQAVESAPHVSELVVRMGSRELVR